MPDFLRNLFGKFDVSATTFVRRRPWSYGRGGLGGAENEKKKRWRKVEHVHRKPTETCVRDRRTVDAETPANSQRGRVVGWSASVCWLGLLVEPADCLDQTR